MFGLYDDLGYSLETVAEADPPIFYILFPLVNGIPQI